MFTQRAVLQRGSSFMPPRSSGRMVPGLVTFPAIKIITTTATATATSAQFSTTTTTRHLSRLGVRTTTTASRTVTNPRFYSLQSARLNSTTNGGGGGGAAWKANPSYHVYGETTAFVVKMIPPEFRVLGGSTTGGTGGTSSGNNNNNNNNRAPPPTVVLDGNKKGRLLMEWVERPSSFGGNKFSWDRPLRFALSPEEVGLLVARLKAGHPVELNRQVMSPSQQSKFGGSGSGSGSGSGMAAVGGELQKVLRAYPNSDGSVRLICDYELEGRGGQDPPTANEATGPLEIDLMVGEYQVLQSIMEYSMPRLSGWAPLMDQSLQHAMSANHHPLEQQQQDFMASPHDYSSAGRGSRGGGRDDGVPF